MNRSGGERDLVEPEGVNAGSGDRPPEGDAAGLEVRSGGAPEKADEQSQPPPASELIGPPHADDEAPGSEPAGRLGPESP
jgi:hypothetical protein